MRVVPLQPRLVDLQLRHRAAVNVHADEPYYALSRGGQLQMSRDPGVDGGGDATLQQNAAREAVRCLPALRRLV